MGKLHRISKKLHFTRKITCNLHVNFAMWPFQALFENPDQKKNTDT